MILINIDQLSDAELRYIAQQENLDNWEALPREELIDALEDIYDDDTNRDGEHSKKFIKSLTDVDSDVLQFPGVEPLPKTFNESQVQCILIDPNWAFVRWNISYRKLTEFNENNTSCLLRVKVYDDNQNPLDSYEISVQKEDDSWNIELPWPGKRYIVELIAKNQDEEILATSQPITSPKSFFSENAKLLNESQNKKLLLKSLTSEDNQMINNRLVAEILAKAKEIAK